MKIKMNRLVTLSLMAVMSMCICTSCVKHVDVDAETLSGKEAENDTSSKKIKFPSLEEVSSYSFDQMIELAKDLDENTLIQAWGEPFSTGGQRIWKLSQDESTKYVEAFVQDGKVLSLNNSVPMYAVVAKKYNNVTYCFLDWSDYIIDSGKLCFMPAADVYGNAIECEVGDRFLLMTNGIVMESYPGQLNPPYESVPTGRVSDDELKKIESAMNGTDLFEDVNASTNDESGNRAFVTGPYGKLSLMVPETWSYEIANVDGEKLLTGCYGIILKPNGIDNGQIEVVCADNFAVCGTGLVNEKNTLAGSPVRVGTYDADAHWSFIVFEGENPQVVVNHTDCTSWSDSTWNEAWSILDTISFDRNQTEGGIGQFDPESENADIGVIMTVKNVTPKGLTVHFWQYENKTVGELDYGEEFSLEKKDGDTWVLVPQVIDDAGFTLEANVIPPGGETEINVNWEWIYGRLEPGTYRINKSVIDHRSDGNTIYTLKEQFVLAEPKVQNDPDLKWIKECYFQYLTENNLIYDIYAPKSADELSIETYVGVFGNGCVVAYMSGDGLSYTEAERTEVYGNNKITFRDGQICYAFYQNKVYTIGQAYELGILNNEDILRIDSIVGVHS